MTVSSAVLPPSSPDEVRRLLIAELASILQVDASEIDPAKPFDEYGLDSTDAVVVVGLVEERMGIELEPELLLRNRSIDEVIAALLREGKVKSSRSQAKP